MIISTDSLTFRSDDGYYEIVIHAIQQLENVTRSVLSKNLMNNPTLTPSLMLVDRVDVFKFLDKNPKHPFNRINKPKKGMIFPPIKKVIELRGELKRMVEDLDHKKSSYKPSKNISTPKGDSHHLVVKIEELESRLQDRNQEIKG